MKVKVALLSVIWISLFSPIHAESGAKVEVHRVEAVGSLSQQEMAVLRKHYQWKKSDTLPKGYTLDELYEVMDKCADNTLELEDYDWQARKIVVALMVVGDKQFAKELDGRAVPVQHEVVAMLKPLWAKYKLQYPEVQALAKVLDELKKKGE